MSDRIEYGNLQVAKELDNFLREEVVPGIDVDPDDFWKSFEKVLEEFGAKNKELLEKRETIQKQIDEWHLSRKDEDHDHEEYVNFLKEIGYLLDLSLIHI